MIKEFLKKQVEALKANIFGYYCPDCSLYSSEPTSFIRIMKDHQHNIFKYYLKCRDCRRTTPAFKTIKEAKDFWDENWISKEVELFKNV